MPIEHQHEYTVRALCAQHEFSRARDYLLGLKSVYDHSRPSRRSAYHLHLATCYSKLGNYQDADTHFDLTIGSSPTWFQPKTALVDSLLQRGAFRAAEDRLTELLEHSDLREDTVDNFHLQRMMGRFFKLNGDYESALDCLKNVEKMAHGREDGFSNDMRFLEKVLSSPYPDRREGLVGYANFLRKSRMDPHIGPNPYLAITFLKNRLDEETAPERIGACHSLLTRCYLDIGRTAEALSHAETALGIDPGDTQATVGLILCHLQSKDLSQAALAFGSVAHQIKQNVTLALPLAREFHKAGAYGLAQHLASHVLNIGGTKERERESARIILGSATAQRRKLDLL